MGKAAIFIGAMVGISIGKACVESSKPVPKKLTEEEKMEQIDRWLSEPKKPKEQPRKYPRALPGGGLDWTGVEGGPKE